MEDKVYIHTNDCSLVNGSDKCDCGAWESEKEIEPTETIQKQDRETLSRMNGKEFSVLIDSHEHSSPSENSLKKKEWWKHG